MTSTGNFFQALPNQLAGLLLGPGSTLSIWALGSALMIAVAVALVRRKGRAIPMRVLRRALFPRRMFGASARVDFAFLLISVTTSGFLFAWAIVSHQAIANVVGQALSDMTGWREPLAVPGWIATATMTIALFVAYEFAYWLNHLMSHKIGMLWRFHQVHHSAETLSPVTIFRVHPVDNIAFYNTIAIATGSVAGVIGFLFGNAAVVYAIGGTNVITLVAILTLKNLQHSHVWLAFTGLLGRVLLSPAHHQIHHSDDPRHFGKNLGATLALFDWTFGTLHEPTARRQTLRFGVADLGHDPRSVSASIVRPVLEVAAVLATGCGRKRLGERPTLLGR